MRVFHLLYMAFLAGGLAGIAGVLGPAVEDRSRRGAESEAALEDAGAALRDCREWLAGEERSKGDVLQLLERCEERVVGCGEKEGSER